MVKQRFSSADVAAEAACLRQRCLGMRVANVYDINPKVGGGLALSICTHSQSVLPASCNQAPHCFKHCPASLPCILQTYVLKLARSGEDGDKVLLLVESGVRFHTIAAMPPKADTPSNFTLKLRKHIRCGVGSPAMVLWSC